MLARPSWITDISIKASGRRTSLVGNPNWRKDGYWSGNGQSSLYEAPAVKHRPLVREDQRKALIELVGKFLAQWRSSPWENEGPARHQLRTHFIRLGHSWALSDLEADKIIQTALRKLGYVKRPTWEEGQPESLKADQACLQCGRALKSIPGRAATAFFCHPVPGRVSCEDRYNAHRDVVFKASQTAAAQRLYRTAFLATLPPVECGNCRTIFKPKNIGQKFCCHECASEAATEIQPRACACCGTMFKPVNLSGVRRYCSPECSAKGRTTSSMVPCENCQTPFRVHKSRPRRFCSTTCFGAANESLRVPKAVRQAEERKCLECETTFIPASPIAKLCSDDCRKAVHRRREQKRKANIKTRSAFRCDPA